MVLFLFAGYIFAFLIGGLILFNEGKENFLGRCFVVLLPILIFGNKLGEFTFSSESTFFDRLMVFPKKVPYLILKIKYAICVSFFALISIVYIIVFFNKIPILFWLSTFFFGCGLLFFNFQNAVYNRQRFDILDSSRKLSNFTIQSLVSMIFIGLSLSIVLVTIKGLTSETTTEYTMLITGIIMMATSPFWLKNIYKRFLVRKYQNMEGFRNS